MSWSFSLCSVSEDEKEAIPHFIDIGGIVDHYCLNFLRVK
jgi:hypothetical protein